MSSLRSARTAGRRWLCGAGSLAWHGMQAFGAFRLGLPFSVLQRRTRADDR